MRLVSTLLNGVAGAALLHGGRVYSLVEVAQALGLEHSSRFREVSSTIPQLDGLTSAWAEADATKLLRGLASLGQDEVELLAPVRDADKIICVGLNYAEHVREVKREPGEVPTLFPKFRNSLRGPYQTIVVPRADRETDYEGELAVVIGRRVSRETPDTVRDAIAGVMVMNDVSARALQRQGVQWTRGKAIDTYAPCGPALVTIDEISELQSLGIRTRVNGELLQDSNTRHMIWTVHELISFISETMTLEPGDIIATGTPEGIGARRTPPRFLEEGDVVEIEIDEIGAIRNEVVFE